ncbi:MAG: D-tyrosyl-tRNA(Tyr) deacylase [Armatimonadetes bacterium]|nr:MAG: D-tyrosyl-tRNA(Tyr) deacylase [Armatimonadota bacterium]
MRLVIQRIKKGKVSVAGKTVSETGVGLFVLVGVGQGDKKEDAEMLAEKLFKMRIMADDSVKMNLTVNDAGGEFLVVSQFTLYGNTKGGNRPSFIEAARPEVAEPVYKYFVECLRNLRGRVATGAFGEYMKIDVELDGPVTIIV